MRTLQRSLLLVVLAALIFIPRNIFSCGPFFDEAVFSFDSHPDFPMNEFINGKLGILKPAFYRVFLAVAYRNLSNHPYAPGERAAIEPVLNNEARSADAMQSYGFFNPNDDGSNPTPTASSQWLAARAEALGQAAQQNTDLDPNKPYGEYQTFLNCNDAAFLTAIKTLHDRQQKWGAKSDDVRTWIAGQDDVFSNCSSKDFKEPAAVTTNNKLLKQDRDYQIAAALFYSGQPGRVHDAEVKYEAIANDATSPWRVWAPYLAARAQIRQATLNAPKDKAFDPALMNGAEATLRKVHAYKDLAPIYAASDKLLGFVLARLHPQERLLDVARHIANGTSADPAQDLLDFRYLMDAGADQAPNSVAHNDDLVDWVRTFQDGPNSKAHALDRWHATKSLPWLVAAVNAIDVKDPALKEVMDDAAKVNGHDPRLLTVLYDRMLLMRASNDEKSARALIDANVPYLAKDAPLSARNLFWGHRMAMSQSFDDFVHFAPREDAEPHPDDAQAKTAPRKFYFDTDASAWLNQKFSLALLAQITASPQIPKPLQNDVAQAAWVRSIILNKPEDAARFAASVKQTAPTLSAAADAYAKAATPDDRRHDALFTLLNNPGLRPYVVPNMQRTTEVGKIDDYRDNWWCADVGASHDKFTWQTVTGDQPQAKAEHIPEPVFLTPADKSSGAADWTALTKLGAAPNFFANEVIAWAKAAPDDPRVPEALHLVVRATRYGCTDDKTSALSKQAFQLLHSKYPKSEWTKKTPYFY